MMGIRKKIFVGFVIIGFVLFLSGVISVFQLVGMEKSISGMLSDNVKSVELSKYMMYELGVQSWQFLDIIAKSKTGNDARLNFKKESFDNLIGKAYSNITVEGEQQVLDSLKVSFNTYSQIIVKVDSLLAQSVSIEQRMAWYNDLYQPAYIQFDMAIEKLRAINQNALTENSMKLERNFYRMLMPPIIAIAAGLLLVILFNYFINLYFISPILRINKGIKLFLNSRISYSVSVDTKDEINDLNEEVKILISQFKRDATNTKHVIDFKNKK